MPIPAPPEENELDRIMRMYAADTSAPVMPEERANALRRQQSLGMLSTLAGGDVGEFGTSLYGGATAQIKDAREEAKETKGRGLDQAVKAMTLAKGFKELGKQPDPNWTTFVNEKTGEMGAYDKRIGPSSIKWLGTSTGGEAGVGDYYRPGKLNESSARRGSLANMGATSIRDAVNAVQQDPSASSPGWGESASRLFGLPDNWSNLIAGREKGMWRQEFASNMRVGTDAALTSITGAAYTPAQLEGYSANYYPQPGDDPRRFALQMNRFVDFVQNERQLAGKAWGPEQEEELQDTLRAFQEVQDAVTASGGAREPLLRGEEPPEMAGEQPPAPGARKAPDGNWYVEQNGQFYMVTP